MGKDNKIKEVTKYQTSDDVTHDTHASAIAHENMLELTNFIDIQGIPNDSPCDIAEWLVQHKKELIPLMRKAKGWNE